MLMCHSINLPKLFIHVSDLSAFFLARLLEKFSFSSCFSFDACIKGGKVIDEKGHTIKGSLFPVMGKVGEKRVYKNCVDFDGVYSM